MAKGSAVDGRSRKGRLATMSTADLRAELERRRSAAQSLVARRDQLAAEMAEVESELSALGLAGEVRDSGMPMKKRRGRPPGSKNKPKTGAKRGAKPGSKRPQNEMSLVDALHSVLKGKTLSIGDACDAVQAAGYRTTSPNFRTIVNQALISNDDKFAKVSRGMYTAK